jgi:hypothetical protein
MSTSRSKTFSGSVSLRPLPLSPSAAALGRRLGGPASAAVGLPPALPVSVDWILEQIGAGIPLALRRRRHRRRPNECGGHPSMSHTPAGPRSRSHPRIPPGARLCLPRDGDGPDPAPPRARGSSVAGPARRLFPGHWFALDSFCTRVTLDSCTATPAPRPTAGPHPRIFMQLATAIRRAYWVTGVPRVANRPGQSGQHQPW